MLFFTVNQLFRWIENDRLEQSDRAILLDDNWSHKQRKRRDSAWAIIRPLIQNQPEIFPPDQRGRFVRQATEKHGVTKQTVYKLRRYWQRGMTPNALLSDHYHSGAAGRDKPVTVKKRGRPRIYRERFKFITLEYARLLRAQGVHGRQA